MSNEHSRREKNVLLGKNILVTSDWSKLPLLIGGQTKTARNSALTRVGFFLIFDIFWIFSWFGKGRDSMANGIGPVAQ